MKHLDVIDLAPKYDRIRDYLWNAVDQYGEKDAFV